MLRVNDFFCGAGGMGIGFKNAGFRTAGAWDFDKFAVESYGNNVSPKVKRADITQMTWDEVPQAEVWTFGFPCQDISIAGKRAGMIKGETRSGLFYEIMRLLDETTTHSPTRLPSVILAENVKAVKSYLPEIEKEYAAHGYTMYTTLYNSKFWGVPQNRERYFILGVHKSITKPFVFPTSPETVTAKLVDILDEQVAEKFYIKEEKALSVIEQARQRAAEAFEKQPGTNPSIDIIGLLDMKGYDMLRRVYNPNGLSPTLISGVGGNTQPKVLVPIAVENQGKTFTSFIEQSSCILARDYKGLGNQSMSAVIDGYRVRRLTPREYARLQGFPDSYKQVVSDTQFYKQMGNAVSVNVSQVIATAIAEFLR